jgi:hypothetical protein
MADQSQKFPKIRFGIVTIIFLIYIIQDIFTRNDLINYSNRITHNIQEWLTDKDSFIYFLAALSNFAYVLIIVYLSIGFLFSP